MQSFSDPSDRSIFSVIHFRNYSAFIRRRSSIISSVSRQIESNGAHTLQGNNSFNGSLIISVGQIPLCKPSYVHDVFFLRTRPSRNTIYAKLVMHKMEISLLAARLMTFRRREKVKDCSWILFWWCAATERHSLACTPSEMVGEAIKQGSHVALFKNLLIMPVHIHFMYMPWMRHEQRPASIFTAAM